MDYVKKMNDHLDFELTAFLLKFGKPLTDEDFVPSPGYSDRSL